MPPAMAATARESCIRCAPEVHTNEVSDSAGLPESLSRRVERWAGSAIPEPQGSTWKRGGLPAWKGDAVLSDANGGGSPGRRAWVVLWLVAAVVLTTLHAGAQTTDPVEDEPPGHTENAPDAEETDDEGTPFFFGEIVVVDEDEEPSSGTTDVLDAAAIQGAGVVTIGQALELLPGVSMSIGGRNEQKVWVRGYEQSNVLLLVDGVPISDPYYGDLDLGQLPIFDVARVSVTRGAASPLYGPNGLAGVINVTTMQGGPSKRFAGDLRLT